MRETQAEKNRRIILDRNNWTSRPTLRREPAEVASERCDPRRLHELTQRMAKADPIPGPVSGSLIFCWEFTPEDAATILDHANIGNRQLSRGHVENLKAELMSGHWVPNVDPIVMSDDMRLMGGQHRLTMIRETGIPVSFLVVLGATDQMKFGLDRGKPWSIADKLEAEKESISTIRVICALMNGKLSKNPLDSELAQGFERFGDDVARMLAVLRNRRSVGTASCVSAFGIAIRNAQHRERIQELAHSLVSYKNADDTVASIQQISERVTANSLKSRCVSSLHILDRIYECVTGVRIPEPEKPSVTGLHYFLPEAKASV